MNESTGAQPPFFSIIIPTLNCVSALRMTMASILEQDFGNYECLLVDGVSTDGTLDYSAKLAQTDPRVSSFSGPDKGLYDAMNKGIRRAKGRYLYFLGAGDALTPGTLGVVAGNLSAVAGNDPILLYGDVFWASKNTRYDGAFDRYKLALKNICHQSVFYDRRIFQMLGEYDISYSLCADWALNVKCFGTLGVTKRYLNHIIANYEGAGLSTGIPDRAFDRDRVHLFLKYLGFLPLVNLIWRRLLEFPSRLKQHSF